MSLDMVANQVTGKYSLAEVEKLLIKLKMSSDKRNTRNMRDWDEALRSTFATFDLSYFLSKYSSIRLPHRMVSKTLVQRQVDELIKEKEKTEVEKRKNDRALGKGRAADGAQSTPKRPRAPSGSPGGADPSGSSSSSRISPKILRSGNIYTIGEEEEDKHDDSQGEDDDSGSEETYIPSYTTGIPITTPARGKGQRKDKEVAEYHAILRARAELIAQETAGANAIAEKRGIRQVALYCNPLTAVREERRHINPDARYPIEVDSERLFYELESDQKRRQRYMAWQLLKGSIEDVPKGIWQHVAIGNVYELYILISEHFMDGERRDLAKKLMDELGRITKRPNELFASFCSRFEGLQQKMAEIRLACDSDLLMKELERALTETEDVDCVEIYETITLNSYNNYTSPKSLFKAMEEAMKRREQRARKKENKRNEKGNGKDSNNQSERAMVFQSKARENLGKEERYLLGICLFYQDDNCKRKNCTYTHEKVSPNQRKKLEDLVKKRNKEGTDKKKKITCYNCGEEGHKSPDCPKPDKRKEKENEKRNSKASKTVNKTTSETSKDTGSDREKTREKISNEANNLTNKQMKRFLKALIKAREKEDSSDSNSSNNS